MFAHCIKPIRSVAAMFVAAVLLVACDNGAGNVSGVPVTSSSSNSRESIISSAPERKATYRDGDRPHERQEEYITITRHVCPSQQDIEDFIARYKSELNILSGLESDGIHVFHSGIDHYSYETVIGTINPDCLPKLDGSMDYVPSNGGESIREEWFNLPFVMMYANEVWKEEQEAERARREEAQLKWDYSKPMPEDMLTWHPLPHFETEASRLLEEYSSSIQMLGIVSALSGGSYFNAYTNEVPHVTNPEMYNAMNSEPFSTKPWDARSKLLDHYSWIPGKSAMYQW